MLDKKRHFFNAKAECAEIKIESIPSADEDDEPACSLIGQKLKNSEMCFILNKPNLHSNLKKSGLFQQPMKPPVLFARHDSSVVTQVGGMEAALKWSISNLHGKDQK